MVAVVELGRLLLPIPMESHPLGGTHRVPGVVFAAYVGRRPVAVLPNRCLGHPVLVAEQSFGTQPEYPWSRMIGLDEVVVVVVVVVVERIAAALMIVVLASRLTIVLVAPLPKDLPQ